MTAEDAAAMQQAVCVCANVVLRMHKTARELYWQDTDSVGTFSLAFSLDNCGHVYSSGHGAD